MSRKRPGDFVGEKTCWPRGRHEARESGCKDGCNGWERGETNAKTSLVGTEANLARCCTILPSMSLVLDVRDLFWDLKNLFLSVEGVPISTSFFPDLLEKTRRNGLDGMMTSLEVDVN